MWLCTGSLWSSLVCCVLKLLCGCAQAPCGVPSHWRSHPFLDIPHSETDPVRHHRWLLCPGLWSHLLPLHLVLLCGGDHRGKWKWLCVGVAVISFKMLGSKEGGLQRVRAIIYWGHVIHCKQAFISISKLTSTMSFSMDCLNSYTGYSNFRALGFIHPSASSVTCFINKMHIKMQERSILHADHVSRSRSTACRTSKASGTSWTSWSSSSLWCVWHSTSTGQWRWGTS